MKNFNKIKKHLPKCSYELQMQVCIFHQLIGKAPSRGSIMITKAYIEKEILYEEVKKLLKLD